MKIKTFKSLRTQSKKEAEDLLSNGMTFLESMQAMLTTQFPYGPSELSKAEADFSTPGNYASNSTLDKSIPATRDAIYIAISHMEILERYITLHIPAIEDGNNFGVGIQLTIVERLKKIRDSWAAIMVKIPTYYTERGGCEEKLSLEKTSNNETSTSSKSNVVGGKDGDESKETTTVVQECKVSKGKESEVSYVKALVAKDVQFYAEMRSSVVKVMDEYLMVLDAMEKNKEKVSAPKGNGGGNTMSMF